MDHNENVKLRGVIKDMRFAMLTTAEEDGTLPSTVRVIRFDGDLWFLYLWRRAQVDEINHNQHVNVSYARQKTKGTFQYRVHNLCVIGRR